MMVAMTIKAQLVVHRAPAGAPHKVGARIPLVPAENRSGPAHFCAVTFEDSAKITFRLREGVWSLQFMHGIHLRVNDLDAVAGGNPLFHGDRLVGDGYDLAYDVDGGRLITGVEFAEP